VSGQKIWTSHAEVADFCELLVRTDPEAPKHRGISWLVMPMDSEGLEVRPLRTIYGSSEFSEMFLDEVRIPVANRVGAENDGWRVAMVTFSFERGTAFVSELLQSIELLESLVEMARSRRANGGKGGRPWDDAGIRRELGHLAADLDALWSITRRNVTQASRTGVPGVGGSVFKLYYSEVRHRLGDLALRIMGRTALSFDDIGGAPTGEQVHGWLHAISLSIAAGTSQIQRNILGERVLGLPRER
jgi:alkylation response protein AidB-like acyl-CoA dehydrogenase